MNYFNHLEMNNMTSQSDQHVSCGIICDIKNEIFVFFKYRLIICAKETEVNSHSIEKKKENLCNKCFIFPVHIPLKILFFCQNLM